MKKKTVIVAPLNWGLGHATRCIPIIDALQEAGATVILASDGGALALLQREFPHLRAVELPAYDIRYPFRSMLLSMAVQGHKILRGCLLEYFWLKNFLKNEDIDAVISDNRFGFFSRKTHSIFMTHQVQILMPIRFLQPFVNAVNHFFIRRFDALWIPDVASEQNLASDLAHGFFVEKLSKKLTINYLGTLSRMKNFTAELKYRAIIVLSGPEPQRTFLEEKIFNQLEKIISDKKEIPQLLRHLAMTSSQFCLVRGIGVERKRLGNFESFLNVCRAFISAKKLTHQKAAVEKKEWIHEIEIHNILTGKELNQKIMESEVVICRSGYSSLMDLLVLQKKALLIPTVGQTEQEYLADELARQNRFVSQHQDALDLPKAFAELPQTTGFADFLQEDAGKNDTLRQVVRELLEF